MKDKNISVDLKMKIKKLILKNILKDQEQCTKKQCLKLYLNIFLDTLMYNIRKLTLLGEL